MRRVTTFWSTTDRIYDGGPLRLYIFFFWRDSPLVGLGLLVHEDFCGFLITKDDTPQSVRLLWTSNQLAAETSA